jgi:hypothetical protein
VAVDGHSFLLNPGLEPGAAVLRKLLLEKVVKPFRRVCG